MARIIQTEKIGTERKRLVRAVVISLRELSRQEGQSEETRDLIAFVSFCLETIHKGIEITVAPWEKRDYWVKADRFRMDWEWTGGAARTLRDSLLNDAWEEIPAVLAEVGQRFQKENVSERHRMGRPWEGAWERMQSTENDSNP